MQTDSDPKRQSIVKKLTDRVRQNLAVGYIRYVFVSITPIFFMTACGPSYEFAIAGQ